MANNPSTDSGKNAQPPQNSFAELLLTRNVVRIVLIILAVLFVVDAFKSLVTWLGGLILTIVFAIFFAYLIAPLVDLVQRPFIDRNRARLMPRSLAIGIVYVGISLGLWGAFNYLIPLISQQTALFAQQVPTYTAQVNERIEDINRRYENSQIPPQIRKQIEESVTKAQQVITDSAPEMLQTVALTIFEFLPWVILIPILGFFFLKDAEIFKLAAVRAFPTGQLRGRAELFLHDLNKTLAAYIRAQLISCALIGTICTAGFYLFGVRYAILLGIMAAVLEFIPLAGPLVLGVIATAIASFYSVRQAVAVAIFLLVLRLIHDYVTYPRIVREGIHLHPLAIILAILAGGEIAGVTGIFLAIPVVAVVTVAYRHLMEHSGSAGLVAELLDEGEDDKANEVAENELETIHEQAEKLEPTAS